MLVRTFLSRCNCKRVVKTVCIESFAINYLILLIFCYGKQEDYFIELQETTRNDDLCGPSDIPEAVTADEACS